jgi:hypothetical protein
MAPASIASRLDPMRLQMIGVRGLLEELVAALDSALIRRKLLIAAPVGILAAAGIGFIATIQPLRADPNRVTEFFVGLAAAVIALVLIAALATTLLSHMTYLELSRLRPASWREANAGALHYSLRLVLAYVVAVGLPLVAIGAVRWATLGWGGFGRPAWLADLNETVRDALRVAGLVVETILWAVLYFALLLGPIVVIEECSVGRALLEWCRLLQRQFSRVLLYETAALCLAALAALPLAIPLALAAWGRTGSSGPSGIYSLSLLLLGGVAAAPSIAYLAAANVFIFLNLQYETNNRRR